MKYLVLNLDGSENSCVVNVRLDTRVTTPQVDGVPVTDIDHEWSKAYDNGFVFLSHDVVGSQKQNVVGRAVSAVKKATSKRSYVSHVDTSGSSNYVDVVLPHGSGPNSCGMVLNANGNSKVFLNVVSVDGVQDQEAVWPASETFTRSMAAVRSDMSDNDVALRMLVASNDISIVSPNKDVTIHNNSRASIGVSSSTPLNINYSCDYVDHSSGSHTVSNLNLHRNALPGVTPVGNRLSLQGSDIVISSNAHDILDDTAGAHDYCYVSVDNSSIVSLLCKFNNDLGQFSRQFNDLVQIIQARAVGPVNCTPLVRMFFSYCFAKRLFISSLSGRLDANSACASLVSSENDTERFLDQMKMKCKMVNGSYSMKTLSSVFRNSRDKSKSSSFILESYLNARDKAYLLDESNAEAARQRLEAKVPGSVIDTPVKRPTVNYDGYSSPMKDSALPFVQQQLVSSAA